MAKPKKLHLKSLLEVDAIFFDGSIEAAHAIVKDCGRFAIERDTRGHPKAGDYLLVNRSGYGSGRPDEFIYSGTYVIVKTRFGGLVSPGDTINEDAIKRNWETR